MQRKIKIAVIGAGWWSTTAHIPGLLEQKQAEIILIDPNAQALQAAAKHYGLRKTYASLKDALTVHPDIRGAIVAVPHRFHAEIGCEVLQSGLHLLIEKPMTLYAKDARHLVELADERKLHLMVGYFYPHADLFKEARKRVDDGLVGDIEYITCSMTSMTIEFLRGKPANYQPVMGYAVTGPGERTYSDPAVAGGGQGHLQATHSTGMMFALAPGLRAEVVTAFMNNVDCKVDVADAFAVRMNNGAVATVGSTGNITAGDHGMLEVHLHGSKGRLRVDLSAGELYLRQHSGQGERVEIRGTPDLGAALVAALRRSDLGQDCQSRARARRGTVFGRTARRSL